MRPDEVESRVRRDEPPLTQEESAAKSLVF
jgi:hypothetical protein